MKAFRTAILISLVTAASALALASPMKTNMVLKTAGAKAKAGHKNVLVIFHASWCGWCHKLDDFLAEKTTGALIGKNYEIVHIDVLENGDKKSLENPGGLELMEKLGGKDAGLPFMAVVSPSGAKLADSLIKPGDAKTNTGYPAAAPEVAKFGEMLKATSKMKDADRTSVTKWLTEHAPKQ